MTLSSILSIDLQVPISAKASYPSILPENPGISATAHKNRTSSHTNGNLSPTSVNNNNLSFTCSANSQTWPRQADLRSPPGPKQRPHLQGALKHCLHSETLTS